MHNLRSTAALALVLAFSGCMTSGIAARSLPGQQALATDGLRLRYASLDPGAAGTGLLFIHGWSGTRDHFAESMQHFAGTYPVAALDLGGHGESEAGREAWSFEILASDVVSVLDELGWQEVVLVGHSLGGPLAVLAAQSAPNRVRGVIAVNALHDVETRPNRESLDVILPAIRSDFAAYTRKMVETLVSRERQGLRRRLATDFKAQDVRVATAILELYPEFDMAAALAACPAPVRAINGSDKASLLDRNRRFDPDFEVEVLEGLGGYLMLEDPARFYGALERALRAIQAGA